MSDVYLHRRLMRVSEVLEVLPVSRSHFYRGVKEGDYPQPIKLGKRTSAWRRVDIAAYLQKRNPTSPVSEHDLCPVPEFKKPDPGAKD